MIIYLAKDLGSQIRDARKRKKLTQLALAQLVGTSQRRISNIEKDPSKTELATIIKLCKMLQLQMDVSPVNVNKTDSDLDW